MKNRLKQLKMVELKIDKLKIEGQKGKKSKDEGLIYTKTCNWELNEHKLKVTVGGHLCCFS